MNILIESLKKTFSAYTKKPFLFVWPSIMYVFLLLVFLFTAVGLLMLYFMAISVFNQQLNLSSPATMVVIAVITLLFLFFSCGLNASLSRAYHNSVWREKTSLTGFFSYALDKAPDMFGVELLRDIVWLVLAGPAIALLVIFLKGVAYVDILVWAYVLFVTFVIHMIFTPAFIAIGSFGTSFTSSLRHALMFLRKRHVLFAGLYVIFAIVWILNFVPILDLVTVFFVYPVVYSAMIVMMENTVKMKEEE